MNAEKKVIYKYALDGAEQTNIPVSPACKVLAIELQGITPVVWIEHDHLGFFIHEDRSKVEVFYDIMTGQDFSIHRRTHYIKTLQGPDGIVHHIYKQS